MRTFPFPSQQQKYEVSTFRCVRLLVNWFKSFALFFVFLQGADVLSQDGTLSLQDVTYDNAGEYTCVGAVPAAPGLTAGASVNLTVKGNALPVSPRH